MSEFISSPDQSNPLDPSLGDTYKTFTALWFISAVTCGAEAINYFNKGIDSGNAKQFIAVLALSALSNRKAAYYLNECVNIRNATDRKEVVQASYAEPRS